jgi:hypothetical protein
MFRCEVWKGMHSGVGSSPAAAAANRARSGLQLLKVYQKYLQIICGVRRSTFVAILFAELGLKPLQFFGWEHYIQALMFELLEQACCTV